jgi:hypothetical protein
VDLTTLPLSATNADGAPWSPRFRTNGCEWAGTNSPGSKHKFEVISTLYPVRLRVFDPTGQKLKEGQIVIPWEMLTNSLAETCRMNLVGAATNGPASNRDSEAYVHPYLGSMLALITVFSSIQSAPALGDICEKARCAVRLPSLWSMTTAVAGGSLNVSLEPRFKEVVLLGNGAEDTNSTCYRLPLDMKDHERILTSVEVIAGPPGGAGVLLAGIQSIRATHPSKANQMFLAQVLATGRAGEGPSTNALLHGRLNSP